MQGYHPLHAARADMQRRDGQKQAAIESYNTAIACCGNQVERNYLQSRIETIKASMTQPE